MPSQTQFISLLYYLGMLTLGQQPPDRSPGVFGYRLDIQNRVIRELQWEHLATLLQEEAHIVMDTRELETALLAMAMEGDIAPFLELFHTRVIKALGLKDLRRFDEKALKLMLLAFISLSRIFYPLSEKEMAQGYCDLFLGVSPIYRGRSAHGCSSSSTCPQAPRAPRSRRLSQRRPSRWRSTLATSHSCRS